MGNCCGNNYLKFDSYDIRSNNLELIYDFSKSIKNNNIYNQNSVYTCDICGYNIVGYSLFNILIL
jgi:hypothetical protein